MFDIGFSEILLIFIIALVVLGPEKLPRLASQVGRWVGRARNMARQFREQLEEEVNLEQARKAQETKKPADSSTSSEGQAAGTGATVTNSTTIGSDSPEFRADTFSHAHATNEYGANPYTPDGSADPAAPLPSSASAPQSSESETSNPSNGNVHDTYGRSRTTDGETAAPSDPSGTVTQAPASTHAPDGATSSSTPQPGNAGADPHGHV